MNCFICNKLLVDNIEQKNQCEKHCEHILHNALRGKLKSQNILCKQCGNKINDDIDVEFVKFFSPVNELFKDYMRKKDHGSASSTKILGKLFNGSLSDFDVNYKDGTISPSRPSHSIDYDDRIAEIFASSSIITNYKKRVTDEIERNGYNPNDFEYINIETYNESLFVPYIGLNIDSLDEKIKLGYNKIASEFALHSGIKREFLNRAIEIDVDGDGKIIFSNNIFPYFPNSLAEAIYEEFRPLMEPNYPTHTLILFTQEKNNGRYVLYCYIELYSTFQNYVILNHDYHQEESHIYHQTIMKPKILDTSVGDDLRQSLRRSHEMLMKVINNDEVLDPLEKNVRKRIDSLSEYELSILEKEVDIIEDSIYNQNMRKENFLSRESYDLTWIYKKLFYNLYNERLESTPKFLSIGATTSKEATEKMAQKYYYEKLQRLLVTIQAVKYSL